MYVLVTYDVSTTTDEGKRRLRTVAKVCLDYGQRVQNSVFECQVDPGKFAEMKNKLRQVINEETDSIRFYLLGNNWKRRVEKCGVDDDYDVDGLLMV